MKKHFFIFLLALLPFAASAQTTTADRTFPLDAFNSLSLLNGKLSISSDGKSILVNGNPITAEQAIKYLTTLQNDPNAAPSSAAVKAVTDAMQNLISTQATTITNQATTITSQGATITNLGTTVTNQGATIVALNDTVAAQKEYIKKLSIDTADAFLNAQIIRKATQLYQSFASGTYFAPTAINFGAITSTTVPITLTPADKAVSYIVKRDGNVIRTLWPANLSFVDSGRTPLTTYSYSATATDGSKISMPFTASATTLSAPTGVPDNPAVAYVEANKVTGTFLFTSQYSSNPGNAPNGAVDGDPNTRYQSGDTNNTAYLGYDFASPTAIKTVAIYPAPDGVFYGISVIEGSTDGTTWTQLADVPSLTAGQYNLYKLTGANYRYYRLRSNNSSFMLIAELAFFTR